jgi:exonuclease SbcD
MRVLHIADVHLDTPFPGRTEALRRRLKEASRAAFRSAVDLAISESVDVVVIAGDLFDGSRLSFDTERFLLEQMQRLRHASIQVVYATGNHDSAGTALRAHELPWPSNVVVASSHGPRRVPIPGPDGTTVGFVSAVGHETARETRDLSILFPEPQEGLPELAVLHTQVHRAEASERHDAYAPSSIERLRSAGYDAWALGHVHRRQTLERAPLISYSGNPQGRTFNETGPKGVQIIDLSERTLPVTHFHETGSVRFEIMQVRDLEGCTTLDRLVAEVARAWRRARAGEPGKPETEWVVRVELAGPCPLAPELAEPEDVKVLSEEIQASLGVLWVEVWARATHPVLALEEHLGRQDVLGEALRLIEHVRSGDETLDALDPGELAGIDRTDPGGRASYLRGLLDDGQVELLGRMLRDASSGGGAS